MFAVSSRKVLRIRQGRSTKKQKKYEGRNVEG